MDKLSEEQNNIVNSNDDNILVIACPGSGKTHTIISKYIYLLNNNILKSEEIILITYTKKAGNEMYNRINNILPNQLPYYVGSLHGFSYKILKEYYKKYIILDDKDTSDYLNNIIDNYNKENSIEPININIKDIIDKISTVYPINIKKFIKNNIILEKYYTYIKTIYKLYQNKKKKEKIFDFNDLMINLCKFLDNKKLNLEIKYIFFDEYQDINPIQNYILDKLLLLNKCKIMIVGDESQSIYAFRGSNINYILNINQDKFKIYSLTYNYRSTSSIINFYQNIIKNNSNKFNKIIDSVSYEEKKYTNNNIPSVVCFKRKYEQYKWITNDIINKINNGLSYSDISILAKNNYSLNNIELYLISNKIPISKHIGTLLLNKPHIKDFLSWINILVNINSSIHWNRIFNLYNIEIEFDINLIKDSIQNLTKINNKKLYDIINHYTIIKNIKNDLDKFKYIIKLLDNNKDNIT